MTEPRFFHPVRAFSVGEIAALTDAQLAPGSDAERRIDNLAPLGEGTAGSLVFATRRKNLEQPHGVVAGAILVPSDAVDRVPEGIAILISRNPQRDFATIGRHIFPEAARPSRLSAMEGIAATAFVDASARLEEGVTVEPGAFIGAGVEIGTGTIVGPNAVIGPNCRIGRHCVIGARVCLQYALVADRVYIHPGASIGQDGFGYVAGPRGAEKMPQLGRVVIQNDVEIGANAAIDRGALGDTVIGEGTKIDNLVQIGHNVRIGRGCMIAGNCGLAGSVVLGDFVVIGGQVGIADHLKIGSFAQLAGGSGVMGDIPERGVWGGLPAKPIKDALREQVVLRELARSGRGKATGK